MLRLDFRTREWEGTGRGKLRKQVKSYTSEAIHELIFSSLGESSQLVLDGDQGGGGGEKGGKGSVCQGLETKRENSDGENQG